MTCTTKQTKGKWLTIAQNWQVIEEHGRSQPSPSLADLARWSQAKFKLSQPPSRATIANILRSATTCTVKSKMEAACTP
ncbi:hypothetical protein PF010_g1572 [Phytophthora fragariae]|uniref:ARS-binding protein 1 N-terminal domain-containing protein n=1 Tax=Phytophthora fragariae TaxID=53985 RepID=A0A6A3UST7_9STRA|nr:hypothetical protein PF003_g26370 [Phytophthora fragariae]KAE9136719.1 hypothetical protein PF010_g1572 [Phytophthora fragariae]KAE9154374.1 hypothetical protein PF006_g1568 [Phytophthora fragariae]